MKSKLFGEIKRILWWQMILATLIIMTLITGFQSPYAASAAGISVTRDLPDIISLNDTFEVTVTFCAPAEDFTAIGLSDFAPNGWAVTVNNDWCNPTPMDCLATNNRADYIWAGPYTAGTTFTAVYQVTVPENVEDGTHSVINGVLEYYLGTDPNPYKANITGESELVIKNSIEPSSTDEEPPTADDEPIINYAPDDSAEPDNDFYAATDTTGVSDSAEGEVADIQAANPAKEPARSGGQHITPNPAPSEPPLLYPPAAQSEPVNWPALCGIASGVVIIVLITLLLFRRGI